MKCTFGNPVLSFLPKVGYFLSNTRHSQTITQIYKKKSIKRSPGHVGCRFDKTGKSFTPKVRFILLKNQKVWANVLPSTNCPINVPLETYNVVLATPPIFFCENKDTFAQRPKSSCKMQNSFFFPKNDLKLFLWTRKKCLKTLPFFC